jgi:sterol 3beta-glucosyltransferase
MRIVILTVGTIGDIQPFAALAAALQKAGHEVSLATHSAYAPLLQRPGLDFIPLESNPQELLSGLAGRDWLTTGGNAIRFIRGLIRVAEPMMRRFVQECLQASQGSELIIASFLSFLAAYHVSEKVHTPIVGAFLQPITPTRAFPSIFFPPLSFRSEWINGGYNRFSHLFVEQAFWQLIRPSANACRREILGLPAMPLRGPFIQMAESRIPILYGYSPSLLPKPPDWDSHVSVTGYWFPDPPKEWQPPEELVRFLESGSPPVFIGLGSMSAYAPPGFFPLAIQAVKANGMRAIIQKSLATNCASSPAKEIFLVDNLPHEWLFPRVAAIVHHGGIGTVMNGLRAGVPAITVPFFADQPFWGRRLHSLGIGARPIPWEKMTLQNLQGALHEVTDNPVIRFRAAEIAARIRTENGPDQAVEAIHTRFS